mmetsp:Transcript_23119/g.52140  ORF Transcript_23119/g.52140 Transcript_23119/m.52140 type:complete len:252 (-) Transcript_23119:206-961(-)
MVYRSTAPREPSEPFSLFPWSSVRASTTNASASLDPVPLPIATSSTPCSFKRPSNFCTAALCLSAAPPPAKPPPLSGSIKVAEANGRPVTLTTATLQPVRRPGSTARMTLPLSGGWSSFCRRFRAYTSKDLASAAAKSSARHSRTRLGSSSRLKPSSRAKPSASSQLSCAPPPPPPLAPPLLTPPPLAPPSCCRGGGGEPSKLCIRSQSLKRLTASGSRATSTASAFSRSPRLIANTWWGCTRESTDENSA